MANGFQPAECLLAAVALWIGISVPATSLFTAAAAAESGGEAVRSVWQSLDATWNAREAEEFSRLFAEDASLEFVDREQFLESRAAILKFFSERFPTFSPDLRHLTSIREVRAVADGVQVVDGTVEIFRVVPDGSGSREAFRKFAIFAVMTRTADAVQIKALRIYRIPAAAEGS